MIIRPVIEREMAQAARQWPTYYTRTLGAVVALIACAFYGVEADLAITSGKELFSFLHTIVFFTIWICVPFAAADCLSRERREGTLGLLFLTHLSASDIVVAKGFTQALRGGGLWLAVLPVLMIPLLLGGVGWAEALLSIGVNLSSLCLALAAGLLASASSKVWTRALVAAAIWAGALSLISSAVAARLVWGAIYARTLGINASTEYTLMAGLGFLSNVSGDWGDYLAFATSGQLLMAVAQLALFSILGLLAAVLLAGMQIRRSWQEAPATPLQRWFDRVFCRPVFWLNLFRGWMRRKLERNPIGWLEQRRWTGRLVTWTWLAILVSVYSAILTDSSFYRNSTAMQLPLVWLLIGSMAVSAAGSFRRERENGMLELLLVSPLREEEIIWGRVRGLWAQFMPAAALLLTLWSYLSAVFHAQASSTIWSAALTLALLPTIGLYFSVRCRTFVVALGLTFIIGILLPWLAPAGIRILEWLWIQSYGVPYAAWNGIVPRDLVEIITWSGQAAVAYWCWLGLVKRLRKRSFPLQRAPG